MATVEFRNPPVRATVERGTSILRAARNAGAPVASTCGGVAACSSCHVIIHDGAELLSEMDDEEETVVTMAREVTETSRLACQAEVVGEGGVVIEISEESSQAYQQDRRS